MKQTAAWLGAILVLFLTLVWYYDLLPPRTTQEVAGVMSELPIPSDAEVVNFIDQDAPFGRGFYLFIHLKLADDQCKSLAQACKAKGYRPLPITEEDYVGNYSRPTDSGYYQIVEKVRGESRLAVLNLTAKQLYVEASRPGMVW